MMADMADYKAIGAVTPERLGCSRTTCAVFIEHAHGSSASRIARDLSLDAEDVRNRIASVWRADKVAAMLSRKDARMGLSA